MYVSEWGFTYLLELLLTTKTEHQKEKRDEKTNR